MKKFIATRDITGYDLFGGAYGTKQTRETVFVKAGVIGEGVILDNGHSVKITFAESNVLYHDASWRFTLTDGCIAEIPETTENEE